MIFFGRYANRSIWRQLLIFLVISICLLSITSSVTAVWISYSQSRQALQQNSLRIADNLARSSVLSLITASKENAQEALSQVLGFNDVIGVAIFTESHQLLQEKGTISWEQSGLNNLLAVDAAAIVEDGREAWIVAAPVFLDLFEDAESSYGALEFSMENNSESLLGYVLVNVSKRSLSQLIKDLLSFNIIVTLFISILLIWFLNRGLKRLTRPLTNLSETMNQAQSSGEHTFAVIEGPREVRQMAKNFNDMMHVLEQQEDKLIELNSGLESEVEVRTRELVAARDAALIAVRTQSEFLANISHELRTPLQAVTGYIELVIEELDFHPEFDMQVEDLGAALQSSERLLKLINSILDLAKCEAGKMDLVIQQCSLHALLKEIEDTIRPLAIKHYNNLQIIYPDKDCYLTLDKEKLQQILLNLLSNACKFTEEGEITLSCVTTEDQIIWQVSDTGIGIPEDQIEQVFLKFRQVDGSVKRKVGGTGLGLAIARHFAEMMGGTLSAESKLGQGSTFTLALPSQG